VIAENHPLPSGLDASTGPGTKAYVLLVDDDELILQSMGFVLSHLGYAPVFASTGEEAMSKLMAGLEPVLAILDMDMPGMGGACTLPLIRSLRPKLPVVIATGRLTPQIVELAALFAHVTLMPKPYGLTELKQQLG
jgi:CheY-like chemotaxis protein